jgi:hypothetical protein
MEQPLTTIMIDETHRLAVYYDTDFYDEPPYEWGNYQSFTVRKSSWAKEIVTPDEHTDALQAIVDNLPYNTRVGGDQPREVALHKHLERAGMVGEIVSLYGATQSIWAEVLVYLPKHEAEYLDIHTKTLRQYYAGEVYYITYQELIIYTAPNGNTIERWETVEACGGNYLDNYYDENEVREVANYLAVTA